MSNRVSYKYFSKPNKSQKLLKYKELCYYDLETVPYNFDEDYKLEHLNLDKHFTSFTFIFHSKFLLNRKQKTKRFLNWLRNDTLFAPYLVVDKYIYDKEEYVIIQYYIEDLPEQVKSIFVELIERLPINKFIGFNSEKFDMLALKGLGLVEKQNHLYAYKDNEFYDSIFWGKQMGCNSLAKMGDFVNNPKTDIKCNSEEEFLNYNTNDCVIVLKYIHFLNKNDMFGYTPTFHTRQVLKEHLYNKGFQFLTSKPVINNYTLFGGRTEVFKTIGEELYYYDYNSLYPSVMYYGTFPKGTVRTSCKNNTYLDYQFKNIYLDKDTHYINKSFKDCRKELLDIDFITPLQLKDLYNKYFTKLYYIKVKIHSVIDNHLNDFITEHFPFCYKDDIGRGQKFTVFRKTNKTYELFTRLVTFKNRIIGSPKLDERTFNLYLNSCIYCEGKATKEAYNIDLIIANKSIIP